MNQIEYRHYVKFALPKGNLRNATASLLNEANFGFNEYNKESRFYRLKSQYHPNISAKIFQEKDIPVQVAIGNYDIGICGQDWVEELLCKYPESSIVKLADLGYDSNKLYLTSSRYGKIKSISSLYEQPITWKIVSEYPNLCEQTTINLRLRRFRIFPVWGAAESYPPENADLILIKAANEIEIKNKGLIPLQNIMHTSACLIINKESWQTKNLGSILEKFNKALTKNDKPWLAQVKISQKYSNGRYNRMKTGTIRLALPDGHQLTPTSCFLDKCNMKLNGYSSSSIKRRPSSKLNWLQVKIIRPQDMPLQVATDNFDLAITGKDWLLDHICRFPSSPVIKLLDLGFGKVKMVAVVDENLPVCNIIELQEYFTYNQKGTLRVASEYINIADYYLHNNHISKCKIIPTFGATEALIPEDADLLIENTQTGKTLIAHKLKIIDTLFNSSACLISNKASLKDKVKINRISEILSIFKQTNERIKCD